MLYFYVIIINIHIYHNTGKFLNPNGNIKKKKHPIVKVRMFDFHKDIWSLGFPFIL